MPFNNLDSTAAQISKMTPQQRQQFAQMHKSDPIMMSLVSFVQNQDEAIRSAQMAKMTGQEPPKVVDQIIASMNPQAPQGGQQAMPQGAPQQPQQPQQAPQQLPENMGIATLPTPNMQNMADGGITGHDPETGYLGNEGVPQLDDAKLNTEYQKAVRSGNSSRAEAIKNELEYRQSRFKKYMADGGMTNDLYVPDEPAYGMGGGGYATGESVIRMAEGTPKEMFTSDEDKQLADFDAASKLHEMDRKPAPQVAPRQVVQPAPQRPMSGPMAAPTAEQYKAQFEQLRGRPEAAVDPWAAQTAAISAAKVAAAQEESKGFKEDIAKLGLARKGQEERLGKREQGLSAMEEKNSGLALLQAGLAMMQSKGRGLSGIAEGAGVGLNAYKAGMDKISSAKEKIDEARDQIEQYRRNEDMLTSKEARALKAKANDAIVEGQQKALDGTKQAFGVDSATALKAIELSASDARAQQENATKLQAAKISANAPPALLQLLNKLGDGDIAKGFEIYKSEGTADRQRLAELKVLATKLESQTDPTSRLSKPEREAAKVQLKQVIDEIYKMSMPSTQAPSPGNRPPLSAFMK